MPERAVLLTFDDAYKDHYQTVYPILRQRGLQGSFFIPGLVAEGKVLYTNKIHYILASEKHHIIKSTLLDRLNAHRAEFEYPNNTELLDL